MDMMRVSWDVTLYSRSRRRTKRFSLYFTWLMTSCIECSRMPRVSSAGQESNMKTFLSRLSEAWIGSAAHNGRQDPQFRGRRRLWCITHWSKGGSPSFCHWLIVIGHVCEYMYVCVPGGQVLKSKPDSAGCSSLSMSPRERREGEKMTGRFVWTHTGCIKLYGIKCSSWPKRCTDVDTHSRIDIHSEKYLIWCIK